MHPTYAILNLLGYYCFVFLAFDVDSIFCLHVIIYLPSLSCVLASLMLSIHCVLYAFFNYIHFVQEFISLIQQCHTWIRHGLLPSWYNSVNITCMHHACDTLNTQSSN